MMISTMSWKGCWKIFLCAEHSWIHTMIISVPLFSRPIVTRLLDTHFPTGGINSRITCQAVHHCCQPLGGRQHSAAPS